MNSVNDIPNGWIEINLGKLGQVITGKTPSKNNPNDWGNDFDFITPSEIDNSSKYIFNTPRKLSQQGFDRFSRMILPTNSVIVTCIGSDMGKVVMNKNRALTNQQINSIAVGDKYNNDYVFYLLRNAYRVLRRNAEGSGSTMPILNKSSFELLTFVVPEDIKEQKAIANILTAFDDKIENLQAQNKTLEQTAQTIFKEWFGKYQVGDELPDGWRFMEFDEVSILSAGGDKPKAFSEVKNKPYSIPIYSNGIKKNGLYGYTDKPKIKEESVTISARGTIGFVCLRSEPYVPIVRLVVAIPKQEFISNKYLYLYLKNMKITGTGTTQQQLTVPAFRKEKILVPNAQKMEEFTLFCNSVFEKIKINFSQIHTLKNSRDILLPKLMSGKIRVNEFKESRMECI